MSAARFVPVAVALGWLLAAGCGPARLKVEKQYTMDAGEVQAIDLDAIAKPQTVTVEFSSSASEVRVFLIKNFKAGAEPDPTPTKEQTLESKQGKEGSFSVVVPENTATRVIISGVNAKTEVRVKLTNAK
jgi:hypothetical protein